jgi:hypothetical protein
MTVRPDPVELGVDELRLDPDNPRFVTDRDTTDLATFLPWFNTDADLLAVASSIATNGYHWAEPLLVAPRDDGDARLVVVEGNRRFAAVLLLLNPELLPRLSQFRELSGEADHDELRRLPCLRYSDRNEILEYLGNRHVVGVKEWKPLAKARYVRQLRERAEQLGEPSDDRTLAKRIGSNAPYVRRLLNSLQAFEAVELRQAKDEARFSILQTALQYSKIADFVGIGARTPEGQDDIKPDALQELATWTLEPADPGRAASQPRVNTRTLDLLNEVVENAAALDAFRDGANIERAHRLTGAEAGALLDALADATEALASAVNQANRLTQPPTDGHRAAMAQIHERVEQLGQALDSAQANAPPPDEPAGPSGN